MAREKAPRSKKPRIATPRKAPGDLEILRSFLNTAPRDGHRDRLAAPEELKRFLAGHGWLAIGAPPSETEHRRGLEIRDALLALLRDDEDGPSRIRDVFRGLTYEVVFSDRGVPRFSPRAEGGELALSRLLGIFVDARRGGRWSRLQPCAECGVIFYDASNRRHRKWCTDRCGERVRGARARRRARFGPKR